MRYVEHVRRQEPDDAEPNDNRDSKTTIVHEQAEEFAADRFLSGVSWDSLGDD
ncbi:hypothetical protein RFM68_27500 [Mesorhizobium sp. MSK_1335]|uniref:Uncharacterized protein n=1 Tax=Mesorhizobium montanum TaxID=3072323 RepID=A0ABU4ZS45_9HYPH|nr:hypothetical protein [Mesorhizobium sp. MSK_1335]MDX8528226.1 hypothetical protein [Mesorhizobium sp. MSK_1335]